MTIYNVYSKMGMCECVECNGIYYPIHEEDNKFLHELILAVERKEVHN